MHHEVSTEIAALSKWLRVDAWPTWVAHGVDWSRGGFFEALDLETKTCRSDFRRLRVLARQTYVFSEAHRAGIPGADAAVQLGLCFLEQYATHPQGGYAWRFDLDHRATDLTRDLYDHAFVLLALASATSVVPAATLRPNALHLLAWIEREFPHPQGGYLESLPHTQPRRQNPHMHLLEALLAAYEVFGDLVFIKRADALVDVFASRLVDEATGALPEFFDENLSPHCENGAFLVEPGHHCEWVWLLHRYQALAAQHAELVDISDRLISFVDRHAIDPKHGGIFDVLDSRGRRIEPTTRLWPQTERLKAEFLRPDRNVKKQLEALRALRAHLRPDGLWYERRDASGHFMTQPAPASSLYHLTSAIRTIEQTRSLNT